MPLKSELIIFIRFRTLFPMNNSRNLQPVKVNNAIVPLWKIVPNRKSTLWISIQIS